MRPILGFLLFGLLGVGCLMLAFAGERWAIAGSGPGLMLSYVLIHIPDLPVVVVFGAGALLQFILFGILGFVLGLLTYFAG